MTTISIIVQRDMFGAIAEYTVVLRRDGKRWALATESCLTTALREGKRLQRNYRASRLLLDDGTTRSPHDETA